MPKLIVIGAGPMGLATAYFAAKAGYAVELVEASGQAGGMAAHFDFGGLSLERFYHFCCRSDVDTLELMAELGIPDAMKWVDTKMGYFVDGHLHAFGDPISLLKFPVLSFVEKLRYGLMAFCSTKRNDWRRLDKIAAKDWFTRWCGKRVYEKLWQPLFALKFYEYADVISAAWVWQRIKRLGNSRKSLFQEELGYIEGGTQTLVDRLCEGITKLGGVIRLGDPVTRIVVENGTVMGIEIAGGTFLPADAVISTAPLPYMPAMLEQDAPALGASFRDFENVGVACIVHKLKRQVSGNFWVNISDARIEIPGFVEFSNLRPTGDTIVYIPYYMPASHPKFSWPDRDLIEESFGYLKRVNPALADADLLDSHVGRLTYAQPVCTVGFADKIPPFQTPVAGLSIADTSYYYPEDRGVSESIKFAKKMVAALIPQAAS